MQPSGQIKSSFALYLSILRNTGKDGAESQKNSKYLTRVSITEAGGIQHLSGVSRGNILEEPVLKAEKKIDIKKGDYKQNYKETFYLRK